MFNPKINPTLLLLTTDHLEDVNARQAAIIEAQARLIEALEAWLLKMGVPDFCTNAELIQARAALEKIHAK